MSPKKFYKTVLKVEVLSEEPFEWEDLSNVHDAITTGDCSGRVFEVSRKILSAKQVANELLKQGSDPEFFQILSNGCDVE